MVIIRPRKRVVKYSGFYVFITLCMAGVAMGEIAEMLVERAKTNRLATKWETKVYGHLDDLISVPMRRLVVNLIVLVLIILFGAIAVHFIMGHSMIVSLYHATATVTTIGYGDVDMTVKNVELSQWFHIFYCLVAATWAANLVGSFAEAYIQWDQGRKIQRAIDYGVTEKMLKMIDTDGDGVVSRGEFVAYMIIKLNKIDKECIQQVENMFDELDIDNSGTLDRADIRVGQTDIDPIIIESNPTAGLGRSISTLDQADIRVGQTDIDTIIIESNPTTGTLDRADIRVDQTDIDTIIIESNPTAKTSAEYM